MLNSYIINQGGNVACFVLKVKIENDPFLGAGGNGQKSGGGGQERD